jgi:hypothetical protein
LERAAAVVENRGFGENSIQMQPGALAQSVVSYSDSSLAHLAQENLTAGSLTFAGVLGISERKSA